MSGWFATRKALQTENAELRRQYGERVALERGNLKALEGRFNALQAQYDDLALRYDALLKRFRSDRASHREVA